MDAVKRVAEAVRVAGGRALLVGGCVRDQVQGVAPKDFDVEVYGLSLDRVVAVLKSLADEGKVNEVGRSFGVLKVRVQGADLDVSLPRRDSKVAEGHKGFTVQMDESLSVEEAAARRDFTMNSMAMDPLTGEVLDPFNGRADLAAGVLRHTSEHFAEDPLRVLRGMQFAARFNMVLAPETAELCKSLVKEAKSLAKERVWGEFEKMLVKGTNMAAGLKVLRDSGWLAVFPELAALVGLAQHPDWHPEGCVWTHTVLACSRV
jgi:tRNA nucleotidyltransferase (CCA-adding enzyme)